MSMRELIYHKHYWSIPHSREVDNRIVQICYDCGKERVSPIRLASREPDRPLARSQEPPCTMESGEQTAPLLQHPAPHFDLFEAVAKRFVWKKKLAGG